jgi:hypothetical protein
MKNKQNKLYIAGIALGVIALLATQARAGGDVYPLDIRKVHGKVEVRLDKPGSRWKLVKPGSSLPYGLYLLRTGPHSYVHLSDLGRRDQCLDAKSLIRVGVDGDAYPTLTVLRGRISAVDGK